MRRNNLPKRPDFVDRRYVPLMRAKGRNVLHVGVGGAVTSDAVTNRFLATDLSESVHGQLSKVAAKLTGLDVNGRVVEAMQGCVPGRYVVGDVSDPNLYDQIQEQFDLILFLEVVQDLGNVDSALENMRRLLKPGGELIISACNAFALDRILKMFFSYESVYPDHLCYHSYMTLKNLLQRHGFTVDQCYFTYFPRRKGGGFFAEMFFGTTKMLCRLSPQFGEGILLVARPVGFGSPGHVDRDQSGPECLP